MRRKSETDQPYEVLKRELSNRTSFSEQRRLQQLLTSEELGDRKPSQVLRRIQQLLGEKATTMDPTFMRELFLQPLPSNVRMVLTPSAEDLNLNQLTQLADRIMEASPNPVNAATHTTPTTSQLTTRVEELMRRLDELSTQMSKAATPLPDDAPDLKVQRDDDGHRTQLATATTQLLTSVGTIKPLEMQPRNAYSLFKSRKTPRPVARGDEQSWPINKSSAIFT